MSTDRSGQRVADQRARVLGRTKAPDLPDTFDCSIVGVTFAPGYPRTVRHLERVMAEHFWTAHDSNPVACWLVRDPANEYDANAIRVECPALVDPGGFDSPLLGHLPRAVAERLAPSMDAGVEWSVDAIEVNTSPENVDCPGVVVHLSRVVYEPGPEPVPAADRLDAVIAEAVGAMSAGEVEWELETRWDPALDPPIPDSDTERREQLVAVIVTEKNERTGEWA